MNWNHLKYWSRCWRNKKEQKQKVLDTFIMKTCPFFFQVSVWFGSRFGDNMDPVIFAWYQYSPRPISTLVNAFRFIDLPPIPFAIFFFDRLTLGEFRLSVDDFRLVGTGDDPRERPPLVGDAFLDLETGDVGREFGREEGLEEGRDRESYGVT